MRSRMLGSLAVLAVALLVVRASVDLGSLAAVAAVGLFALLGYWTIYYVGWLRPNERALVKNVAVAILGR
jgi:membrane-bound metal-dependent hydrolase YbcI (DUF457 family)